MKIIIGLGNPEEKYSGTWHNIGFDIISKLREDWNFPDFEFSKKFNAEISEGNYKLQTTNYKLLLVKPQTFMNLSGETINKILEFYKLTPSDIIVIHDDLDIALGKFKIATDSTSAGHNGVRNIIDNLGTQKFKRLRIGIGEEMDGAISCRLDAHDYVLRKFSEEEVEKINSIFDNILDALKSLL